ncbi:sigma-70 family RNA polymerase sigma factor [Tautonia plasticadhaerens]|uniref:ECF RNA polymerase sigma factor SigE n=1 Tax=Tautonia plasticadhaerens TaxID=2527974 RepID=A0A518HBQ7_9BACT|nr:sigma-70 family RNA polymerase sigma factor [Tautonia plasticadhaerens]QDV38294.1 ECF RNA polymerase sigma factor SigE [Tautonia plasticadhaerens]
MNDRSAAVSSPLRTLFTLGATGTLSDGELLGRYLDGRAEEAELAFSALVERHGPMVRHACLAVLDNHDDAGDAFQAAFLVLARRAPSIRDAESVGPWLYGVSRRVSLKARSAAARRRRAERSKAEQDAAHLAPAEPEAHLPEDWATLYQELDRLPPRYRDPLVLCYLEGFSYDQAASRLGCPTGTLRTRLARAKARLRSRLARRGLSPTNPSSALLTSAVSPSALAPLPTGWVAAASRLALAARGLPLAMLSAPLAVSTLRSMTMIALTRSIAFGGASLLGLGAGIAALSAAPGPGPAAPTDAPPAALVSTVPPSQKQAEPPSGGEAEAGERPPIDSIRETGSNGLLAASAVEGPTRVLKLVAQEGAVVEKGQVVLELDASDLWEQLSIRQVVTEQAQADHMNATRTREVAELHVMEYEDGIYPREEATLQDEIDLKKAELELAQDRLTRIERNRSRVRDVVSEEELKEARVGVLRAEIALRKAERALELLTEYSSERQIKSLEAMVENAKADELAKQSRFKREKEAEERLRRMIEKCRVEAPAGGVVRYEAGILEGITEGAPIREGMTLFTVFTDGPEVDDAEVQQD